MIYLLIAVVLSCFVCVRPDCIWYDCDGGGVPNFKVYSGPPKPIEKDTIDLIKSLCEDDYGNDNYVREVDLHLNEAVMNGIYHACDSIWVPFLRQRAVEFICGSNDCDPFKFFSQIGSTANGQISFSINIKPRKRIHKVLKFDYRLCNKSYDGSPPCGCSDCDDTCGEAWPQPDLEETHILGLSPFSIVMLFIFIAGLVSLAVIIWMKEGKPPIIPYIKKRFTKSEGSLRRKPEGSLRRKPEGSLLAEKQNREKVSVKKMKQNTEAKNSQRKHPKPTPRRRDTLQVPKMRRKVFRKREKYSKTVSVQRSRRNRNPDTDEQDKTETRQSRNENSRYERYIKTSAKTTNALTMFFRRLTRGMITRPWIPLLLSSLFVLVLSCGIASFTVEKDPIRLWSDKRSQSFTDREYYNQQFGPFFRVEQLIIQPTNLSTFSMTVDDVDVEFGPVFEKTFLKEALKLQLEVQNNITMGNKNLSAICFAPLVKNNNTDVSKCMVLSVFGYFGNDPKKFETYTYGDLLQKCIKFPVTCLAPYGGPVQPQIVLGGYPTETETPQYLSATSLIITFLVNNHNEADLNEDAMMWEKNFEKFMEEWKHDKNSSTMRVAYHSERSFGDELEKQSKSEIFPLMLSYCCMFIYIVLGLGRRIGVPKYFVYSKIGLAFGGIVIVIVSITSSVGLFSYIGIPVTLIVIEVVPFLVLAVGTDNMFLMVQTLNETPTRDGESNKQRVIRALGLIGPSTLITTTAEVCCFLLGCLSPMPAVQHFCLFAGVALIIAFFLQFTSFVALLSIDSRRQEAERLDLFCCVKSGAAPTPQDLLSTRFCNTHVLPALFRPSVRILIVIFFWALFCFSVSCQPKVTLGLDASTIMEKDSSSSEYLEALSELRVGAPVFFVVRNAGLDYSQENIQNCFTTAYGGDVQSLGQLIHQASRSKSWTYIANPAMSWMDDFFEWISESYLGLSQCCRFNTDDLTFCQPDDFMNDCDDCQDFTTSLGRPQPDKFGWFLYFFLQATPDAGCPKAGRGTYSKAIQATKTSHGLTVGANSYMTYHTQLRSTMDYVRAMEAARMIADKITDMLKNRTQITSIDVFPYSVSYIFYEQFVTMRRDVLLQSCFAITAVGLCFFIGSGFDLVGTLALLIAISSIWSGLWGMMYIVRIPLNAISAVNIILAIGIAVEFCGHMIISYTHSEERTSVNKAAESLRTTGFSVFTGITVTKVIGILMLAFAKSPIYNIFYFQMYLIIIFLCALHGLILTPIMMSLFGELGADKFWNRKNEELKNLQAGD